MVNKADLAPKIATTITSSQVEKDSKSDMSCEQLGKLCGELCAVRAAVWHVNRIWMVG